MGEEEAYGTEERYHVGSVETIKRFLETSKHNQACKLSDINCHIYCKDCS